MNIQRVLILYPLIILLLSILFTLITSNTIGFYYAAIIIIFGFILNPILKQITYFFGPFPRPNPPKTGCYFFPTSSINQNNLYGMPSGHAQIASLSATLWTSYIKNNIEDETLKMVLISSLSLITLAVIYSRVKSGCHTWLQVIVGSIIGKIIGHYYK